MVHSDFDTKKDGVTMGDAKLLDGPWGVDKLAQLLDCAHRMNDLFDDRGLRIAEVDIHSITGKNVVIATYAGEPERLVVRDVGLGISFIYEDKDATTPVAVGIPVAFGELSERQHQHLRDLVERES